MLQPIMVSQTNLDFAFLQVDTFREVQENNSRLMSVLDASHIGRLDTIWDSIKSAIQQAFVYGKEKVKEMTQSINDQAEKWMEQAGSMAAEIHNQLMQRLRIFVKSLIDSAMKLIPATTVVGDVTFSISKISIMQKLVLGGSL